MGIRVDNLLASSALLLGVTAALAVAAIALRGRLGGELAFVFPLNELPSYFGWALFQQFVAVGAFWLPFRGWKGARASRVRSPGVLFEGKAAIAVGVVFALAHAPNVGLMLLGFVAETLWLLAFHRRRCRNLFALSLAHAAAALVVSHHLVPSPWLPSMTVGLSYFR
jgi:hypothetical protein